VIALLDRQLQIYSIDTGYFYTNKEARLHKKIHTLREEKNQIKKGGYITKSNGEVKRIIVGYKEIEKKLNLYGLDENDFSDIVKDKFDYALWGGNEDVVFWAKKYKKLRDLMSVKTNAIHNVEEALLKLLSVKVEANIKSKGKHHIRKVRENEISNDDIISVFESSFTRTIQAKQDELCKDFMVIQVYYFDIIKDLIYHGFEFEGEKYIYFTSSAGQIRTKKVVFIKESIWKQHEKTIMCGLTVDEINRRGGNNPNKHLAYLALANSATDVWEEFNIDKTIVIDDFETEVFGTFDLVDDVDYSINRVSNNVVITHTDGAGMMLPKMGKNRMVRLPWVKGLLGVFNFREFIIENNCSPVIKDIYGQEHNVIEEDIEVIFTKSQFKLWKYYDSWDNYKELYKRYGCTAGFTNPEEDRIKNATINYQMLQSLTDISDEEILKIANDSICTLKNLTSSVDTIKAAFGVTPYNLDKTPFQKSIELYPNLLNDEYVKSYLRELKDSMIKRFKAGKLKINGKYTFILPDFYAACEYWFKGIENPDGLLNDGEVFCWLFRRNEKLDCLRSPHLYREHPIRKNLAYYKNEELQQSIRRWFCTDALYTSCKDLISKVLQFDDQ